MKRAITPRQIQRELAVGYLELDSHGSLAAFPMGSAPWPRSDARRRAVLTSSFLKYGLAGFFGTVTHYLIMGAALGFASPVAATSLGAVCGGLVNFLLTRRYVFPSGRPAHASLIRFASVALLGIGVNALVLALCVNTLPLVPSQALATSAVLVLGFSLNRTWTFGTGDHG